MIPQPPQDRAQQGAVRAHVCDKSVVVERLTRPMLDQAVQVHLEAFRGYTNAKFGAGYVRAFLDYFEEDRDAISLAALLEGKLVGYAVGAPIGYARPLLWQVLPSALIGALRHPWVLADPQVRRAVRRKIAAFVPRRSAPQKVVESESTYSLVGIGTSSNARRRGVGTRLVRAFEAEALNRGAVGLRLTVYKDNDAGKTLYRNCGWLPEERPGENYMAFVKRLAERPSAAA